MRILLPVDGSDQSFEAVKALQHLAPAEEVMVLHVLEVPSTAYPFMMPEAALISAGSPVSSRRDTNLCAR